MADIVTAIVDLLKADAGVTDLCGDRVFGGELPRDEAAGMPRSTIVVQPSGGPPFQAAGRVKADTQRLDLIAYGATLKEAMALRDALRIALVMVVRRLVSGVLVHWVQSAGGYSTGRDRDGAWPYAFHSFQALYSTEELA